MEKMTLNIPNSKYSIEFEKENPFIFKVFRNGERSEVSENSLVGELLNLYLEKTSGCATVETLEQCETQYLPPVPRFISCPSFGQSDGMDGSCHWCKEMTPYQFYKKTLVVTEAVVDAMAFMSILYLKGERYKKYNYLALTGTKKIQAIRYHLEQDPTINKIILGFDNDEAGRIADEKTREMLKEMNWQGNIQTFAPPYGKDFNDSLIYIKEHNLRGCLTKKVRQPNIFVQKNTE